MSDIESSPHSTKCFSLQHLSIQKRLPLLMCIPLLCVIIAFSRIAYFGLKRATLQMGRERLANHSLHVRSMFGQAGPTLLAETRAAAAQDAVKEYLSPGFAGPDTAALHIPEKLQYWVYPGACTVTKILKAGVGLALVKRILNQPNGEIWAESVPGKGASFYFSYPKAHNNGQQ